jgi:hypothetical protein
MTLAPRRPSGPRRSIPALLLAVALAADVGALVAIVATLAAGAGATFDVFSVGGMVTGAAYPIVGWIIASRRPGNSIGWVFLAIGLSQSVDVFASVYANYGLIVAPGVLPFADLLSWIAVWAWAPGFTLLVTLSVLLFPDGHLPSPRWRPVLWASVLVMGLLLLPVAIATWPYRGVALLGDIQATLGPAIETARVLQSAGIVASPVVALLSIAGMVVRFRRSGPTERQQLKWFTFAAIPEVAFIVSSGFLTIPPIVSVVASVLIAPLLPIAATVAILRYHLFEIDRLVSRTVSYAAVTGLLVATYAVTILVIQGPLGALTGGDTISVAVSTLAVAALFQPVRGRVQRIVDRNFNRARYDAERITVAFSERLRDEVDLRALASELDSTVRRAIGPSSVGVWLRLVDR